MQGLRNAIRTRDVRRCVNPYFHAGLRFREDVVSGSIASLQFVHMGVPHPLLVFQPHAFPNIVRCNWFPHSSVVENAFGCRSVCAQTTLPPGPLLGPHPHMKNAFLTAGPQCIYIHIHSYIYYNLSAPKKKNARTWWIYMFMFVVDSFHFCYACIYLCLVCFLLFGLMICMQIRLKDWPGRKQRVAADQHFIWITSTHARCESNWLGMKNAIYKKGNTIPPP